MSDPETTDRRVTFAAHTQTEEVIEALLALPSPADLSARARLARALAQMADPAAETSLPALAAASTDAEVDRAHHDLRTLLGRAPRAG